MPGQWDGIAWPVNTERLELRPAVAADIPAGFALRTLPEVAEWGYRWPRDLEQFTTEWLPLLPAHLTVLRSGRLIGDLMLRISDGWAQADVAAQAAATEGEIGYSFHPDHQGQGYATEAVHALVDLAFGPLGLRRLTAGVFAANAPSWRVLERVGFRRESENLRDSLHRTHGWVDGYTYAMLADEWPHRRG